MNALFGASDSEKQACGLRFLNISSGNGCSVKLESAPRELGRLVNANARGIFPFVESVCFNSVESLRLCQRPGRYSREKCGITHLAMSP
jgi:hypothetical protein